MSGVDVPIVAFAPTLAPCALMRRTCHGRLGRMRFSGKSLGCELPVKDSFGVAAPIN
jgi:hypothetical protein